MILKAKRKRILAMLAIAVLAITMFFGANAFNASAASYVQNGVNWTIVAQKRIIREDEKQITDASEMGQHCDEINISDFGYNVITLRTQGYKTMAIIFQLDVREVNDGYQEFFIYSSADSNASKLVTPITNFEHDPTKANTTYVRYEFYAEISLIDIANNKVFLRYGANGKNADTWKNKFVEAQIGFSTDARNYTALRYVGLGEY